MPWYQLVVKNQLVVHDDLRFEVGMNFEWCCDEDQLTFREERDCISDATGRVYALSFRGMHQRLRVSGAVGRLLERLWRL